MTDEQYFFQLFTKFFDAERDAKKQHDISNYSLDRMIPLAELAGHPELKMKIIHVAGTKGKGSTSHYISNLLLSAGHSVGLFTSPHLVTVRERFEVNGKMLPLSVMTEKAECLIAKLNEKDLEPSLFEIFTVLALQLFADAGVEYAVLETGIGGALDSTNYVPEKCCSVITSISFDHMALLGRTIEEIASQKAGIIAKATPVVMAPQPYPAAADVIRKRAKTQSAPFFEPDLSLNILEWLPENTPDFLKENFRTAWKVLEILKIVPWKANFFLPELPARCQKICKAPMVILDAAHNEDSARRLVEAIHQLYSKIHFTVVLGIVAGKDVAGIVRQLKKLDADFILTNPQTMKGTAMTELQEEAARQQLPVTAVINVLNDISQLPQNSSLLFTGSFFTCLIGQQLFGEK